MKYVILMAGALTLAGLAPAQDDSHEAHEGHYGPIASLSSPASP